jgi:hypothetical protein
LKDLLDKRLVFVTGKGGVGKSTVAAAMAMRSARAGRRTILCEVGAQEHISRTFHRAEIGYHEVELQDNLWAISIDPDESMREYVLLQLKVRAMRDLLFRSRIFTYLAAATPGLKELVTIGKIWELTLSQRKVSGGREYDLVVVDAPATGHGVGFLQTPRTFANVARVGPLGQQAETLDGFIRDPERTGVALIALPVEMPVNETVGLERALDDEIGVQVDRIICNGLYPERFAAAEAERLSEVAGSVNGSARAACRSALGEFRRAAAERDQLARLEGLTEAPVSTLPYLFVEELGTDEIGELSELVG